MTSKRVFQLSLLLPMLVPLLVAPAWYFRESMNETIGFLYFIVVYSGLMGGIPYLILAVGLLIWMRNKDLRSVKRALLLSPVLMLVIFAVCLFVYTVVERQANEALDQIASRYFGWLIVFGIFVLIFGYAYVGIAFMIERLWRPDQG